MKCWTTDNWDDYLGDFAEHDKDVYFRQKYLKLYENSRDSAECFVCRDGDRLFLFPYLRRKVEILGGDFWDFETVYGYGGPIVNTPDSKFKQACFEALLQELKDRNFIAGLIRFHPLLENHRYASDSCEIVPVQKTVFLDLTQPEADIWNRIHPKHRNTIRSAQKNNLTFVADERFEQLDVFSEIYKLTMEGAQADDFYFFDADYFRSIKKSLVNNGFIGYVCLDEKIIAAAIFLYDGIFGHYHLAGSLKEYLNYKPNNFLIYMAALHLKKRGVRTLHLGGGTSGAEDNSLYLFKKRFSTTQADFYLGKVTLDTENYLRACRLWQDNAEVKSKQDAFLKYRFLPEVALS